METQFFTYLFGAGVPAIAMVAVDGGRPDGQSVGLGAGGSIDVGR